jgi:hypothetical protein
MIEDLGYSIIWLYQNLWGRMQRPYILGGGYRFLRFTFCRLPQRASRLFVRKNCNDLEASAPDRTITRNATPLRLGGGYLFLRFTCCRLLQRAMRRPRRMGGGHPPFTYHLSPFTGFRPGWHDALPPITSHYSPIESRRLLVSWLRRRRLRHRRSLSRCSLPKSPSIYRQANTSAG